MALASLYARGKISETDTALKKNRYLKPRPGLLTSFSNRTGAMILGAVLIPFGAACGYLVFTSQSTPFQKIVLSIGVLCTPLGAWILIKALNTFSKAPQPHTFFSWDDVRIVLGTTGPLGQEDIKGVLGTPKPERLAKLTALAPGFVEIPVKAVDGVEVHIEKATLHIDKFRIRGGGAEIKVDFDALLPSVNFSGINGDMAFNSISQYFTAATGKAMAVTIGKV
jgi:hypothetical protein